MNKRAVISWTVSTTAAAALMATAALAALAADSQAKLENTKQSIASDKDDDDDDDAQTFSGQASWYGVPFNGKKTASGEIFDMNKLSAAHKTLHLPTKILVENPRNGHSTVVRVNDRGPYVRGRVLDLSREAARRLGTFPGVGYVEVTVITDD